MRFGGRYRLAVHNLAGGRRVVQRLGPDDGEVAFQGTFSGPGAEARVRAVDNLRLSGDVVWLTWESFRRQVIVKSFVADYHSPWWVPYKISCVVFHQTGTMNSHSSTTSALISADLGNALSAVTGTAISLTPVQTALASANALTVGTSSQVQAVNAVADTLASINEQIALQTTLLATPIPTSSNPSGIIPALADALSSAGLLAAAVNAASYIGRIGTQINGSNS